MADQFIIDDASFILDALRRMGFGATFTGLHTDTVNEELRKSYHCHVVLDASATFHELKLFFENEADKLFFILKFSTGSNTDPNSVGYRGVVKYETGYSNVPYIP